MCLIQSKITVSKNNWKTKSKECAYIFQVCEMIAVAD